ncbi:glycosyltransferase family 4 protein [Mumia sp. ZJ1417]|uniref:glycosyltransferase family 4 protein n=1 Tax=Mumia sp. ZJ1417 TaxID=2708082 RepID=UPI0014236451|nr:glycosyltransferase family 4 protein [Mumia sp. ZJ1417]QMW67819.1 glycosyltransferase family 4 protein [Mumia sp. ZJ1417]
MAAKSQPTRRPRHVLICNWRDTRNPEGGGSERFVEEVALGLVERGDRVTVFCAAHAQAPRDEVRDGIRFVRRGDKMAVYAFAFLNLLLHRFGRVDLVVDVQNGLPFFTRLATRKPVLVVVHHVHREQWPVVYPGLVGKVGWWIESWLAPRLYRRSHYVAVSTATRDELVALGVDRERVSIVHNGTDSSPSIDTERSRHPSMCVVGRLVPHKQVEHAIDTVAALAELPDLTLTVVGDGWWEGELREYATLRGVADRVTFTGFVDERAKHEVYASSWLMLLPSLKEGWGLVVGEAGSHSTPTVAYRSAGGTQESVDDGESGVLVDDQAEFVAAARHLMIDDALRERLGKGALDKSRAFTWGQTREGFASVLAKPSR